MIIYNNSENIKIIFISQNTKIKDLFDHMNHIMATNLVLDTIGWNEGSSRIFWDVQTNCNKKRTEEINA